jgi:hypothetical protein
MSGCSEFMLAVMFICSWLVELFCQTLSIHMAVAFIIDFVSYVWWLLGMK